MVKKSNVPSSLLKKKEKQTAMENKVKETKALKIKKS